MKSYCFVIFFIVRSISSISFGLVSELQAPRGDVIYIKPTSSHTNVPCPELCLTLSQFAENISRMELNNKSVTTIHYLPGNHTLDQDLSISNVSNMSMVAISSYQAQVRVVCQAKVSFIINSTDFLLIRGLIFAGCGSNRITSVTKFMVKNVLFLGQKDHTGTTLEIVLTNSVITNCSFVDNRFGKYHGPFKVWKLSVHAHIGGAIIANQSNMTITETKFEGNTAEIGGAIFATLGSNVTIIKSTFNENKATCLTNTNCVGGVLYSETDSTDTRGPSPPKRTQVSVVESHFRSNSATYGGVLGAYNSSVSFSLCTFYSNSAAKYGGVVWAQTGTEVLAYRSNFTYNIAQSLGGVMIVMFSTSVKLQGNHYQHNAAVKNGYGGVLYAQEQTTIVSNHSKFWNNTAHQGGVMWVQSGSEITISNSEFDSNVAQRKGGVLCLLLSRATVTKSLFHHNRAKKYGGVLYTNKLTMTIYLSRFWNNTSYRAGVVYILSQEMM